MRADHYESLIASYVNGTLKLKDREKVESLIATDKTFMEVYLQKKELKDFYSELIPKHVISKNVSEYLNNEIKNINGEVYPREKYHMAKKIYKYLTEPVIEI